VDASETGTVVGVSEFGVELRLDKHHASLDQWHNCMLIDDDDLNTITNVRTAAPAIVPMVRETIMAVLRSRLSSRRSAESCPSPKSGRGSRARRSPSLS
jgi:hypothetical protein